MKSILTTILKELVKGSIAIFMLLCVLWVCVFASNYNFVGGVFSLNSILSMAIIYILCSVANSIVNIRFNVSIKDGKE